MRVLVLLAIVAVVQASAAPMPAPLRRSNQFTVVDARPLTTRSPGPLTSASGEALIKLDADVLLLSAERVRELFLSELALSRDGAGKIRLILYPATRPDALIGVVSTFSPGVWEYRVEIPDQIEAEKLVRGIVHSLLLEYGNRGQGPRSAELPLWLVEGLTAQFLEVAGRDLAVSSVPVGSMMRIVAERRGVDYLRKTRQVLRQNAPLSFSQLAYPSAANLSGANLKVFQASAHLFVYELLRTPHGAGNLVGMLRALPQCWNWETALLRGFPGEFTRMLDVEKKWSVDVLAFTARDPAQVWSTVSTLERLDAVLSVPAEIRDRADQLPTRANVTLQQMIASWRPSLQLSVLQSKLRLLEVLRFHAPPDLLPLIVEYHQTLAAYIQKRTAVERRPENRMQSPLAVSLVAQEAIRQLEKLDQRREASRPENVLSVNSPITR